MNSSLPPVAVVVTLHNGASWIRDTLASIRQQTHRPTEIVVIDDNSTDEGPTLAAEVPDVSVYPLTLPSVNGAGPGREQGFRLTTAPLVAFLDQDDLWHPDHLRLLATVLEENPPCPAAFSKFRLFNDGEQPKYPTPRLAPSTFDPWDTFPINLIASPSGVLIRRTALDALGGWPTVGPVTDFLTWYRLSLDAPFVENQSATCAKRVHPDSQSSQTQSEHRASYLQYRDRILRPVLAERIDKYPEQADKVTRRLDALQAGGVLAKAYDQDSPSLVPKAAPALEALATTDPEGFDLLLMFLFWWHLGPDFRYGSDDRSAFLRIFMGDGLSAAPRAKSLIRNYFVQRLPVRVFLQFLREAPFEFHRWGLSLAACRRALRYRWNQLRGREQHAYA